MLGFVVTLVGSRFLLGDLITTLSWIVALQFFLPLYLIIMTYRKTLGSRMNELWKIITLLGLILPFLLEGLIPQAPSLLALILHPADWRSPVLASLTATTLWGMSLTRAYVLPD